MFKDILLSLVAGATTAELRVLLAKFRELNGDEKADQLNASLKNGFLLLKTVTDKTKSKLDDTAVNMILAALD